MDMIGKIRRMHRRDKKTKREISRTTGLSRNTVAKWLDEAQPVEPKYRREAAKATKLSAHEAELKQALKADAKRPKKERRTAKALFTQIKAAGYEGGYTRVTDFIRKWRQGEGQQAACKAFVPLTFELGEAFQFDWSEDGLLVGGVYYRMQVSHMKLCASGAFWLVAYPSQGHEMLFDAHTRSFAALGGVARRGIYDNMKTAVDKVKKGKGRVVNARFAAMCAHYLFDPDFCNRASGWEKGRVEKDVQDSRRRIWVEAGQRRFGSFTELNAWLGERCRALWRELRHPQHKAFSIAEMLELEQSHLMPMPVAFDGYVENPAKVSSTCLVTVARNRYSVPCEWAGQMVSTHLYPAQIVVVAGDAMVATHERLSDRNQTRYDWQHYVPLIERKPGALRNGAPFADLPEPLQRMRKGLLHQEGGDRVMAQVLAEVPKQGLDAVLVAVELALESAPPSGRVILTKRDITAQKRTDEQRDEAIRQIISNAVVSDQVVDIFDAVGLDKPNIGLLDDEFLAQVKNLPEKNLAVELLERLLEGEIKSRFGSNVVQEKKFSDLLGNVIKRYQNRSIETAQVMEELVDMAKKFREAASRGEQLGLTEDEVRFYDALATNESAVKELTDETLKKIVHELTENLRQNLTVDWSERESVRAKLRLMVKRILRKYKYPPDLQEAAAELILQQAQVFGEDWGG